MVSVEPTKYRPSKVPLRKIDQVGGVARRQGDEERLERQRQGRESRHP
jgi:hypothetical protein